MSAVYIMFCLLSPSYVSVRRYFSVSRLTRHLNPPGWHPCRTHGRLGDRREEESCVSASPRPWMSTAPLMCVWKRSLKQDVSLFSLCASVLCSGGSGVKKKNIISLQRSIMSKTSSEFVISFPRRRSLG